MSNKIKEESISYLIQRSMPLTNRMGVYVGLNTKYNEPVYIGKAQDYWKRTPNSLEKKIKFLQNEECEDYGCDNITFIPCKTMKEMDELEKTLIQFWKPYYNQQLNGGHFMNNYNKRLRDILRQELGRNLHTYEIKFSQTALSHYVRGNPYELALFCIKKYSTIGDNIEIEGKKWTKINSLARQLKKIISIHYDYRKPYQERTEEEKEIWRNKKDDEDQIQQFKKHSHKVNIFRSDLSLKEQRYGINWNNNELKKIEKIVGERNE
tara:strand:- start:17 stop:811 length:795 start_codon:yes stop_codon:yes gene_type:complete